MIEYIERLKDLRRVMTGVCRSCPQRSSSYYNSVNALIALEQIIEDLVAEGYYFKKDELHDDTISDGRRA